MDISDAVREKRLAYGLLRLVTGIDFLNHGAARIFLGSHLGGFAEGMVKAMAGTPLPAPLVLATGYVVPCVELCIGLALVTAVFTRQALMAALLLMAVLMFGVTLKQEWSTAGLQLTYAFILAALLFGRGSYDTSWPKLLRRDRC